MVVKQMLAVVAVAVLVTAAFLAADTQGTEQEVEDEQQITGQPAGGYIKFAGMDGECDDEDHQGWCDIIGFEYGTEKPHSASGKQTGRRIHDTVKVTKFIDKTTPLILKALCRDEMISAVDMEIVSTWDGYNEVTVLEYELKNVMVTDIVVASEDVESTTSIEKISLSFEEMTITYYETDNTGKIMGKVQYSTEDDDDD